LFSHSLISQHTIHRVLQEGGQGLPIHVIGQVTQVRQVVVVVEDDLYFFPSVVLDYLGGDTESGCQLFKPFFQPFSVFHDNSPQN
jgi:hypothetical protein